MMTRGNANRASSSNGEPENDASNANMMEFMRNVMAAQQAQAERLSTAIETMARSRNQPRPGTVSDFMRLNPSPFSGEEKPLDVEQ